MDIRDYPDAIEAINAIIANKGAAEVKLEGREDLRLVVVEVSRQLKIKSPAKRKSREELEA